ncbi:uncharacterized protein LOC143208472 [Lasioglossum baleicum]|uniref:uncharacterized protein LOC143208472 n=1 Tax=Lasioglossum baleicum TaxID=434251 RepID=UPI003FCE89E4
MAEEENSETAALSREELCIRLDSASVKYDTKDSTERLKNKWCKYLKSLEETQKGDKKGIGGNVGSAISEMATIDSKIKLEFELGKDDWETFVERLELYFTANNVNDSKKKAAILLTRVSADTYKLARNLCHPAKLKDKEYDDVVKIISDHLCPKPSEPMERCKFYAAKQAVTESVSDFVARLKELSLKCNFTAIETALRDQLVCGLKDRATRTELFKQENVTYEKAYRIALACEKAERDATSSEKIDEVSGHGSEVHLVKAKSNSNGRYWSGKEGSTRMEVKAEEIRKSNRENVMCYCCGKRGHIGRECKHRYQACRKCKRQGHIEAACRSQQRNVQCLQTSTEEKESGDASEGEEDVYEFNNITARGETYNTNNIISVKEARSPMYLKVNINTIDFQMEVDTGSYWSIMADETRKNGVKHTFSAPHHPATNGAAENFVGIFKDKVNKMIKSGKRLEEAVSRSPAFMMFKREIRTKLDCVRPNVADQIENAQLQQTLSSKGSRNIQFVEGEKVWVTDYTARSSKKTPAIIKAQLSPVNFEVEISPGKCWKRHVDQMFKYREENNSVNDSPGNRNLK